MKRKILVTSLIAIWLVTMPGIAVATEWSGPCLWHGPIIRLWDQTDTLAEGINDTLPIQEWWWQVPMIEVAYEWTPSVRFDLKKIEFYSTGPGAAYVTLMTANSDGTPGNVLRKASFSSLSEGWQGIPFASAYTVKAKTKYFVSYAHELRIEHYTVGTTGIRPLYFWTREVSCPPSPPPTPTIQATIDIDPNKLNLKSKSKHITAYIELPEDYDIGDIDASSVYLDGVQAEVRPTEIGDHDNDGIGDLMVKFDWATVQNNLGIGSTTLAVTGTLNDSTPFEGADTVTVFDKGK